MAFKMKPKPTGNQWLLLKREDELTDKILGKFKFYLVALSHWKYYNQVSPGQVRLEPADENGDYIELVTDAEAAPDWYDTYRELIDDNSVNINRVQYREVAAIVSMKLREISRQAASRGN